LLADNCNKQADDKKMLELDLALPPFALKRKLFATFNMAKITAVYGASGIGKSSLLQAIAGFNKGAGSICYAGQYWQKLDRQQQNRQQQGPRGGFIPAAKRGIGYVMQESLLFPHLSLLENIEFARHKQSRFSLEEVLELLAITDFAQMPVSLLSGGQQQRVALARALVAAKNFLLFDEPLSALDIKSRDAILVRLSQVLKDKALGGLYVSHGLNELALIADDFCLLDDRGWQIGALNTMLTDPASPLSTAADAEAVVEASYQGFDADEKIVYFTFAGGEFQLTADLNCNASSDVASSGEGKVDETVRLRILAKDVSVCLEAPKKSSILNIFPASITAIKLFDTGRAMLYCDVSGQVMLASISQKSLKLLALNEGSKVFLQVKAVAVV
jgi:molybdate transport system ATP-binding protein